MSEWDKKILKIFSCIFLHYRVASNQFYFQIEMPEIKPSGHAYGSKLISGEGRGRRGGGVVFPLVCSPKQLYVRFHLTCNVAKKHYNFKFERPLREPSLPFLSIRNEFFLQTVFPISYISFIGNYARPTLFFMIIAGQRMALVIAGLWR